jgi:hypothetical protein
MGNPCPICLRDCDREHLVFGWRICPTLGFAFLLDTTGALVELAETNRSQPQAPVPAEQPPARALNPPRLTVNGVTV